MARPITFVEFVKIHYSVRNSPGNILIFTSRIKDFDLQELEVTDSSPVVSSVTVESMLISLANRIKHD